MTVPLLFLPGLLCDAALWRAQIEHFSARRGVTVGCVTRDDSIAAMASRVLAEAPPVFALAGLSMGGYVALEILRQAPERVAKLALIDTQARADNDDQRERRTALMALARQGRFRGVTPRLLPLLIHKDRLEDAPLCDTVMGMAERVGQEAFLRQQTAILGRIDSRPHLEAIHCPTLVLCGAQDALTPPELAEEMADIIPRATLSVVPDCGHLAPLEQPAATNAALDAWLEREIGL